VGKALAGKVCLVTGANSGIGKAVTRKLLQSGATVIMACRDRARAENAMREVSPVSEGCGVAELLIMDLSSQQSIREGVAAFSSRHERLDVLINNAGVLLFDKALSEDGIEKTLATNFLGPFLLTNLLMESLQRAPTARIVNVVSEGTAGGALDLDTIGKVNDYKAVAAYSQSKQAEILWTYELAERLKGSTVTANCYYPGLVKTNLGKTANGGILRSFARTVMTTLLTFLFTPMEESIKIGLFLAAGKTNGLNGRYLLRKKGKVVAKHEYDRLAGARLWELAEGLTCPSRAQVPGGLVDVI
jgi:NAD(P)-dependent dehydrogenase (short-subunit alcohol dehydrogenase family)